MIVNQPEAPARDPRHLAMHPEGLAGRTFGKLMEAMNAGAYALAADLLAPLTGTRVLEIGFGTGRLLELLLAAGAAEVLGIDPSPTMLAVARRRRRLRDAPGQVQLRLGDDGELGSTAGRLDAVAAVNSFQFWAAPAATLAALHALLAPGGRLALVLRDHGRGGPDWLPNPLSRAAGEAEAALALVAAAGFTARLERRGRLVAIAAAA
jgi:SAM-dependent methyltransferase